MVAALTQLENERDEARAEGLHLQGLLGRAGEDAGEMTRIIESLRDANANAGDAMGALEGQHRDVITAAAEMEDRLAVLAGERSSAEERMAGMEEQIVKFRELEPRMLQLIAEKNKAEESMFQAKNTALGAEKAFNDIHLPVMKKVEDREAEVVELQKQESRLRLSNRSHAALTPSSRLDHA